MNEHSTKLNERKIAGAAEAMGWRADGDHWTYPVPAWPPGSGEVRTVIRHKALNSEASPKYWWTGPSSMIPPFYFPPKMQEALHAADGLLHVVNGEPAVLTMMQAGIRNVLACFGEGRVPPSTKVDLKRIGVKSIIYYPDGDKSGERAALKFSLALDGAIPCIVARPVTWLWPALPEGADLNDLWRVYNSCGPKPEVSPRDAFTQDIAFLAQRGAQAPLKRELRPPVRKPGRKHDTKFETWATRDEEAARDMGWREDGKRFACPAERHENDDHAPASLLVRGDDGRLRVFCHKCDESWTAYDAAGMVRGDWHDGTVMLRWCHDKRRGFLTWPRH